MTENWAEVARLLEQAREIASKLSPKNYWRCYIDEVDCYAALDELITSAQDEAKRD